MQKDYRKCLCRKKIHGAEELHRTFFLGGYFTLKALYQNDTTAVCFKQICRFPDCPTPASHYSHGDQAETCRGGCRKWKWLQPLSCIWQKQIKSTAVCAVIAGRTLSKATGGGIPRTLYHSTRMLCKLPDQTQESVATHASSLELMLLFS